MKKEDGTTRLAPILERVVYCLLGAAGIIATLMFAQLLSSLGVFGRPVAAEAVPAPSAIAVKEAPMVAALTDEEIGVIYISAKREAGEGQEEARKNRGYISPIVFGRLQVINKDVYAWISIAGTTIDYPILQHPTDRSKYLNYKIDGSYGRPGCIYTENTNSLDFSDNNTVIYGHNMKNGTMFADLHKFRKREFFNENREIIIYLPDRELHYEIFAAYIYDDRHLMDSFYFAHPSVYASYLKGVFDNKDMGAIINRNMTVTKNDRIITLSTCVRGQDSKRLLVQAVLTNPEALTKAGYPQT
ncbi:MAG: class B sortase [Lachnospiraceae bacterium]|jgi:sortase B|nr:class B sortase [Lachnospiraceae bacterium]